MLPVMNVGHFCALDFGMSFLFLESLTLLGALLVQKAVQVTTKGIQEKYSASKTKVFSYLVAFFSAIRA
jgi:hypothetical protein